MKQLFRKYISLEETRELIIHCAAYGLAVFREHLYILGILVNDNKQFTWEYIATI